MVVITQEKKNQKETYFDFIVEREEALGTRSVVIYDVQAGNTKDLQEICFRFRAILAPHHEIYQKWDILRDIFSRSGACKCIFRHFRVTNFQICFLGVYHGGTSQR